MFTKGGIGVAAVLLVTLVTTASAHAQSPAPPDVRRPYRGLFGGPSSSESRHSLILSGSIFAAYDDNITEAITNDRVRSPWLQESGTYQGATAGLNYRFSHTGGERVGFGAGADALMSYYRSDERSGTLPAASADLQLRFRVTRSLSLTATQIGQYSSTYNSALDPRPDQETTDGIAVPDLFDLGIFDLRSVRSVTSVGLSQQITQYGSLAGTYFLRTQNLLEDSIEGSRFHDYTSHGGSVGFKYGRPMTRYSTLQLGYGIRFNDGRSDTAEPDVMHNVIAGVDYGRPLSFSRRTSLTFGTGSAIVVSERVSGEDERGRRVQARLVGNVSLAHELGRTWTAELRYSRGFRTQEGFEDLYFTDAVTAAVGGLVSRRLSAVAQASWVHSTIGQGVNNRQRGVSAVGRLTYGLSRFLGLYTQYVYYRYRFDENVTLDPRFPRQLDRHGVRVGLTTSVPLIR